MACFQQARSAAGLSYHMAQGDWTETAVGQANTGHGAEAPAVRRALPPATACSGRFVSFTPVVVVVVRARGRAGWAAVADTEHVGRTWGERVRRGGGRLGEPEPCVACGDRERAGGIGMVNRHMPMPPSIQSTHPPTHPDFAAVFRTGARQFRGGGAVVHRVSPRHFSSGDPACRPAGPGGDVMATRFDFAQGLRRAAGSGRGTMIFFFLRAFFRSLRASRTAR